MFRVLILLAAGCCTYVSQAIAGPSPQIEEKPKEQNPSEDISSGRRVLATGASIAPGILLHGSGHFVAGERTTGYRLLAAQGVGLAMAAAGGAYLGLGGASRYGNEVVIPLLVGGTGVFLGSWAADIYGSVSGGSTREYRAPAELHLRQGVAYVYDPQFSYTAFSVTEGHIEHREFSIDPSIWLSLSSNHQRLRLPMHYEWLHREDGSWLRGGVAYTGQRFAPEGFSTHAGEVRVDGRIHLSRIGPTLSGSFARGALGYAMQRFSFDTGGADYNAFGIAELGFGFLVPGSGELEFNYLHRRDGYAGGVSPGSKNGSGFLGSFGITLATRLWGPIDLHTELRAGSALVARSGLTWRLGEQE